MVMQIDSSAFNVVFVPLALRLHHSPHLSLFCNLPASGLCALFSLYAPFQLFVLRCGCLPNGDNCTVFQGVQHTAGVAAYWVEGRAAKDDDFHTCL